MSSVSFGIIYNDMPKNYEIYDSDKYKKICEEIQLFGTGMFTYISLIGCVNLIDIFGHVFYFSPFQLIFRCSKIVLYSYHCKTFIDTLKVYCDNDKMNNINIKNNDVKLSVYAKHIINLVAINKVICHAIFGMCILRILTIYELACTYGLQTFYMAVLYIPKIKDHAPRYKYFNKKNDEKVNESIPLKKFV
jgi:hypothetical protein